VGGPALHATAGATVVGARKFLIAYNINLNTPDVEIAKKIAKAVRFSSGGLRYAKAMGVDLRARKLAQVSINMTDYEQTPLHRVFEMVEREAKRYGAAIVGSEIVGLVPQRALDMAADYYLQLENFSAAQVLENRLAAAREGRPAGEDSGALAGLARPLLDSVAAPTAVPGGGSVAALAGALAACLGQMVAQLSRQKKSQAQHVESLSAAFAELRRAATALAEAIDEDARSYEAVLAAFRLPKGTAEEQRKRNEAIEQATKGAADVPMQVAEAAVALLALLDHLEPMISPSMMSDLRVGRLMAVAAARGALENVAINLESLQDAVYTAGMRARMAAVEEALGQGRAAVQQA
jgi:formiminotetrahydrofolate cyclodeaminase